MKGILTFTLAAGVAITTSSVVQAAGVSKGASVISKAPASAQGPVGSGSMGMTLDRVSLTRELDRLTAMLNPIDGSDEISAADAPVQGKFGTWSF